VSKSILWEIWTHEIAYKHVILLSIFPKEYFWTQENDSFALFSHTNLFGWIGKAIDLHDEVRKQFRFRMQFLLDNLQTDVPPKKVKRSNVRAPVVAGDSVRTLSLLRKVARVVQLLRGDASKADDTHSHLQGINNNVNLQRIRQKRLH
jgi:hypothetical protein